MSRKRGAEEFEIQLHNYLVANSVRENDALQQLQKISLEHARGGMLSPPDSVAILQLFAKIVKAKTAVEVGVFTGYTSLGIAQALPPNGKLYGFDISQEYADIGKPYWEKAGVADRIELRIGEAQKTLPRLIEEIGENSVDLGFIDADKTGYDFYYEQLLKLVRPGGVILVDNVLWSGSVIKDGEQSDDTKAIIKFNAKLHSDERVTIAMLKNSDGITVALKN